MKNSGYICFSILVLFACLISIKSYSNEKILHVKLLGCIELNSNLEDYSLDHSYSTNKIQISKHENRSININQDTIKAQNETKSVKRPFFGKVFTYGLPPAPDLGPCEVGVFKTFYIFGLKLYGPRQVTIPLKKNEKILIQEVVPCGTEYVPKKEEKKSKGDKLDKKVKSETTDKTETQEELEKAKPKRKMDEQFFN